MKKLIIAALAAVSIAAAFGFAWQGQSGADAHKALNEYQSQVYKDAGRITSQEQYDKVQAQIKAKADDLTRGVDISKVDPKDALEWAEVFHAAGKYHET